jgi:hypothetical protein
VPAPIDKIASISQHGSYLDQMSFDRLTFGQLLQRTFIPFFFFISGKVLCPNFAKCHLTYTALNKKLYEKHVLLGLSQIYY